MKTIRVVRNTVVLVLLLAGIGFAEAPKVVKTIPANGDQNVNPKLRQIKIVFNQPMSHKGYSVCGGGENFPNIIGKLEWFNATTLVMKVKLEPNHEYSYSVNCQSAGNFKNRNGESAEIYPVSFKTGAATDKSEKKNGKAASVMLEEGLYAEQTEGNLDKAIDIYEQVLDKADETQEIAAKAAYQIGMCYLKKGDKDNAAKYFQIVTSKYADQKEVFEQANQQLDKMGLSKFKQGNIFEILGPEVCTYIGSKYGEVCAEAGTKKLYSNSHIYVVDSDFILKKGGLGYVYNWTGQTIKEHYRISGSSSTDQKFYSVVGIPMDVEIAPDEQRKGFYNVYWNPKEPLQPGEFFNYGWAFDNGKQLSSIAGSGTYSLTMQNNFGDHAYETFFLAVPEGTIISSQSEEYTNKNTYNGWDIYWWKKELQENEGHIVTISLQKAPQYTQEMHNEIDPNGLIHFKGPEKYTNEGTEPMASTGFINSDFVNVTGMYYKNGQPMKYTTTHEGNHFRYKITFDKPILPGETIEGTTEGTIKGLIKPVAGMTDTYQYYMKHSPNTDIPTLRIETYLLPKGAEVISTSADMKRIEKDGRVELSVEKVIPAGGSLLTTFQYQLGGAKLAALGPLKLQPAPWIEGEVMELRLKHPSGQEYGTIIYSAQSSKSQGDNTWQIISHMYVTEGSLTQYTFVDAKAESFAPIYGQTTNWGGNFVADYNNKNVKLTVGTEGKEASKDYPLSATAYDNEQAVYLIRRMPLAENYEGSFPIFTVQGASVVECRIKVIGVEDITVEAGTFKCYKTDLSIYSGDIKALRHTLWFSADQDKYLVKYDVGGAATMELAKVWQRDKNKPLVFENSEPHFSVTIPTDWRFYKYESPGPQFSLQLIPPEVKFWAVLVWQQRGTDPASESATTIAKANCEQLKGFFEKYTPDNNSWKEFKISDLEAAQFFADYQDKGSGLKTYDKPKEMVEYRTYIVDQANVYWFVFRVEKEQFNVNKAEFDSIVNSFVKSEKPSSIAKADKLAAENLVQSGWQLWKKRKLSEAEEKFIQAVKIDPGNDNAFQGLGWSQLNQGKKLNAKDSFEKCVKLNPKNSAALNGLGWIEHGQGNIDQAIQWWEKAVAASNGTATTSLSGLTQVYMERKDYEMAVKYYNMWLKAEPGNQDAVEGLKKAKEAKGN